MSISSMMKDKVSLVKADGRRFPDIRAHVSSTKIITDQGDLPIEEGDKFERVLPNGLVEAYEIVDRGFHAHWRSFPAHYQCEVRKATALSRRESPIVYNITGPNARVNINSTDLSANIVNISPENLFTELRRVLQSGVADEARRAALLRRVDDLEQSKGKAAFVSKYRDFVAAAADHMTLLAPFIPALAQLLK